ncbi:MAG: SdiA-regulated domain-containing protein [Bacteroidota bacterium]|nr:SdiA-regulated domain-containing protein [Bacteroidota bacterium]
MKVACVFFLFLFFSTSISIKGLTANNSLKNCYTLEKVNSKRKNKKDSTVSTYLQKWILPPVLSEISGIAFIDTTILACVQDESGVIYIYDLTLSEIINEIKFAQAGDYEGITIAGEDAWVLRSDGKLFQVENFQSSKPDVKDIQLNFNQEQNLEGICYDKKNNRLLILPRTFDTPDSTYKGIYSYNLITGEFSKEPIYKIDLNHELLTKKKQKKKKKESLIPSGIAIHPYTENIYIIDAKNAQVVILDKEGEIKQLIHLNKKVFPKTEGIAFTENGEIFLSNEEKKQSPNILKVRLQ